MSAESGTEPPPRCPRADVRWAAVALVVFSVAALFQFRGMIGHDPTVYVPVTRLIETQGSVWEFMADTDARYVAWVFARNARVWMTEPWRMFDAGACYPVESSLALGEPALTYGLLGAPIWLLGGDPLVIYNVVLWLLPMFAAVAMYLLIRDWTGVPAAGIAAGLIYAFHSVKAADVTHIFLADMSWTVFALYFTHRWLRAGRWRDALALAFVIALQIGGSIYPLVAATMLAPPLAGWMLVRLGVRRTRPAQWAVVIGVMFGAAAFAFSPFLSMQASGQLSARPLQIYAAWSSMIPTGNSFLGWLGWALVLTAAAAGVRPFFDRDERPLTDRALPWVLIVCTLLTAWLSTGGNAAAVQAALLDGAEPPPSLPNLYEWLSALVPSLKMVRSPASTYAGTHLALSLLAGLGAAVWLSWAPWRERPTAAALVIAAVAAATLRPSWFGGPHFGEFGVIAIRPAEDSLAVYESVRDSEFRGPIFEAPAGFKEQFLNRESVLAAAYHELPTSACIASYLPAERAALSNLSNRLPQPEAVEALWRLGFRSVVVRHLGGAENSPFERRMRARLARQSVPMLVRLKETPLRTAYGIRLGTEPTDLP